MSISATDVRRAAMDLLARREHGADELITKLQRRFNKRRYLDESRSNRRHKRQNHKSADTEVDLDESFSDPSEPSAAPDTGFLFDSEDASGSNHSEEDLSAEQLMDLIQTEVQKLTESGLQSNARLAESFIRSRANRGQGPLKIRMELRNKGISDAEIELAMEEAATDWQAIAIEVAEKKFQLEDPDPRQRAKRQRFLQQRGFSFEQIQAVERH